MLGTPTRDQIHQMNSNYREFLFPSIRAHSWFRVFPSHTSSDAIDLVSKILEYNPNGRLTSLQVFCFTLNNYDNFLFFLIFFYYANNFIFLFVS